MHHMSSSQLRKIQQAQFIIEPKFNARTDRT